MTEFISNMMNRPDLWKTGPVDFLWSQERDCWTPHGFVKGVLAEDLVAFDGIFTSIWEWKYDGENRHKF